MSHDSGQRPSSRIHPAAQYQEGLAAFDRGRYPEAIDLLTPLIGQRNLPATLAGYYLGQAHFKHGINELRDGRYSNAAEHLSAARRINPNSAGLSRYLTAAYVGQRRYDLVADELARGQAGERMSGLAAQAAEGTSANPDHDLPIRLAHALTRDGQIERGIATLEDALARAPWRADLRFQLGLLHASAEDYDSAVDVLTEAARQAPLHPDIQLHLGLALGALQRAAEAIAPLTRAHRLRPGDAYVACLLALAADAARAAPAELDADVGPIPDEPADDESLEVLGDLMVKEPDFVESFLRLPQSAVDADVFAMLAATLERALEHHPDFADLHYHCSRVYDRLGKADAAIGAAQTAVELNPRYVQALIQLGRLYRDADRTEEAVARLRDAVTAGGDYPDVHYLLGELFRGAGDRDAALSAFRRALELNEDYAAARQAHDALVAA